MLHVQMNRLPDGDEGLSWIIDRDPTKLLLIPDLQPASLIAAAAGDRKALAFVHFTAQIHSAATYGECRTNLLDEACLAATELKTMDEYRAFLQELKQKDPQLASVFDARWDHTMKLMEEAAAAGEVSAMKWIRGVCARSWIGDCTAIMITAAENGHVEVMRYLRSGPDPAPWYEHMTRAAAPHLECFKWMLSADAPGGPCPCHPGILPNIASLHGLPALQWLRENCQLPPGIWNRSLLHHAVSIGDLAILQWLRAQTTPVPWDILITKTVAERGDIGMMRWMRAQNPPAEWGKEVTRAAAGKSDTGMLKWLRAQDPPCPWGEDTCKRAVEGGLVDTLSWLRAQNPPCPFGEECFEAAADDSDLKILEWLLEAGCPFGSKTAQHVCLLGDLPLLKRFHSAGCSLDSKCLYRAANLGNLQMVEWLCDQGCQLTAELYQAVAHRDDMAGSRVLRFLHERRVPLSDASMEDGPSVYKALPVPMLLAMVDIGIEVPRKCTRKVQRARKAHCTFHGLIQWCQKATSNPSLGAAHAFDILADDCSGRLLLTRLCLLPPELINKIAIAAELQYDIFDRNT